MDAVDKTSITFTDASPVHSNCPTHEVFPSENHSSSSDSLDNLTPRHGSIIPNRIFVEWFDHKVSESDLWHIFSQYGTVSKVNIVNNRTRMTKWYGFVTFENPEDVRKLLLDANGIYFKERRLSIRQAVRKQQGSGNFPRPMLNVEPVPMPGGAMCLTTSSGFPYIFHNGVAYFHVPGASPSLHHWTPQPAPVMVPPPYPPFYHQPACHHLQPRYFQNHCQWNSVESPVGSGPVMYAQPEYLHHIPVGVSAHQPLMDNSNEHFDPAMPLSYPMYPLRGERAPCFVPQHEYEKSDVYSSFPGPPPPPPAAAYSYFTDQSCTPDQAEPEAHGPQAVLPQNGGS